MLEVIDYSLIQLLVHYDFDYHCYYDNDYDYRILGLILTVTLTYS